MSILFHPVCQFFGGTRTGNILEKNIDSFYEQETFRFPSDES